MQSFSGTNELRELAIYFQKNGRYPYYDEYLDVYNELNQDNKKGDPIIYPGLDDMSYGAQEFSGHWRDIFRNGTFIGGIPYTGEHLFYLNGSQIMRTILLDDGIFKTKTKNERKVGHRDMGFPDFWDEDYKYFMGCYIAKNGVKRNTDEYGNPTETRVEAYRRLFGHLDLGIVEEEDNLSGGLQHLYLKPRGVGFSWKLAIYNNYNLNIIPKSQNFIFADNKEYLGAKDGIISKFVTVRDFTQKHAWFLRKNFYKNSASEFTFSTGYKENVGGVEVISGFGSAVNGVIIDGDTDKGRGKRGNISYEEFGSFPGVDEVWLKAIPSVNEYGVIYGQMRGGGTGGGTGEGYESLHKMFYDPKTYGILRYKNPFDDNYRGNGCAQFTPAYINISHKDADGNSEPEEGKEELDFSREEAKKAPDANVFTNHCAEFPYKPSEAFNAAGTNRLPIQLANEQLTYLISSNRDRTVCRYGNFELTQLGIQFKTQAGIQPYDDFPVKAGDKESCVVLLQPPFRIDGLVPDDLYVINLDPYSDEEATESPSIGSWCVEENENTFTRSKGGIEVCWYDGRPEGFDGQNRFCEKLFYAAEFYNAKIVLENNEKGNIVHYAQTHKDSLGRPLTAYLHEQLGLGYDPRLATKKKMKREYGIHMTEARKLQGLKDYQEYLLAPRGYKENEDGTRTVLRNINFIYNRGLLREIAGFNGKNADRISCRIVKMFAIKEYKERGKEPSNKNKAETFNEILNASFY